MERNLSNLSDPIDLEVALANLEELLSKIEVLKKKVTKEDTKHIHLEKEREVITMN